LGYLINIPRHEIEYPDLCPMCGRERADDVLASHHIEGTGFYLAFTTHTTHRWTMPVCRKCKKRLRTLALWMLFGLVVHLAGWVRLLTAADLTDVDSVTAMVLADALAGVLLVGGLLLIGGSWVKREWLRRAAGVRHVDTNGVRFFARDSSYAHLLATANSTTVEGTWRNW
jgi:hypothetical protein